ncbi:uncharacterized protein LOC141665685 [Apium graveolens]|uniref:uncharacterized protein LOC141665685 n=1 Tax=Apium graveolens TaxID=4045 RepID=UPI003D7BFE82
MFTAPITRDLKEACMYKGFGSTLSGPALQGFANLPHGSIKTFTDLVDGFNMQFSSSRVEKVTITNCDVPIAIEAFRRGLERESPLYEELKKYPCRTMDDVQAKAMAQEERSDWRKESNLPPTYDNYGITITPSAMMKEFTKLRDVVKWPVKSNKPKTNPDSKLWCDYHGDYGHKSYECVALRRELQFLTKKGYQTEFMTSKKIAYTMRDGSPRRDNMTPMRQPPPPPHHKSKKRSFREPQQDGLIISIPVGNFLIKRILVDNGSAANIMMLSTLKQKGRAGNDMIKKLKTLVGFIRETKRTLGEITLPTYAQ